MSNQLPKVIRQMAMFTAGYVLFFVAYDLAHKNYEFLFYSLVIILLLVVLINLYRRIELSNWIFVSLSAFGFLHLIGGNVRWNGTVLYRIGYFNDSIHFDNIVHTIGIFLTTLILYNLLYPFIDQRVRDRYSIFYMLLMLMAMGVGTVNEIIELIAVVSLQAGSSVGNYLNNAFDLVFNGLGSLLGVIVIHQYQRRKVRL
ncbi:MAG: DUF2238 domain-containing protein [Candidatus Komeilibacteria bacterium]|nr:DUF2238 domain-containing protein [Candidatus Komeilibacteria bacterium]